MDQESKSELEKRLEGMPLNKQMELFFKMVRDNSKAIEDIQKRLEKLARRV